MAHTSRSSRRQAGVKLLQIHSKTLSQQKGKMGPENVPQWQSAYLHGMHRHRPGLGLQNCKRELSQLRKRERILLQQEGLPGVRGSLQGFGEILGSCDYKGRVQAKRREGGESERREGRGESRAKRREGLREGALARRLLCGQRLVCVFRSLVQACGGRGRLTLIPGIR